VIALHPTEPLVAVCSYFEPVVQLRDLHTGRVLVSLPQSDRPTSVAWHPDGQTLAVGMTEPQQIRLYDRTTLQLIRTLEVDNGGPTVAFNHAGDRLAVGGWTSFVELFDVATGQKLFATKRVTVPCLRRFSRDDRRMAGAVEEGKLGAWQLADGREYRVLVRKDMPEKCWYQSVSVSPDGRLLAAGMTDGFALWDLASGRELAFIPTGGHDNLGHFEPSGSLVVLCPSGVFRRSLEKEATERWVMGRPERLPLPRGNCVHQSRDGRVIVTCCRAVHFYQANAGGWILHTDRPGQPIRVDAGADVAFIAVSPDGRWVVTVAHSPDGMAKVWDARDGKLVKQLAKWGTGYPRFSPDGKWLSTELDGGRLFAVGDWEPGPRVGGAGTFAPDGKLLAVATRTGAIRLIDPGTTGELATLEAPDQDEASPPIFTPDGTRLIAYRNGKVKEIRVWDLRLIRQHLTAMGLDWDAPPYPPVNPGSKVVPLMLKVRSE
jgi:WD40 repeat protein